MITRVTSSQPAGYGASAPSGKGQVQMINNGNTGSAQVFLQSARDLAARLSRDGSPEAEEMVAEALALADTFRRWEIQRPENGARLGSIRQLMDLNRRAMDFLTQSQSGR